MSRLVYMAGPIAHVSYEQARFWRDILGSLLAERGMIAFNPAGAFHVNPHDAALIERVQTINDYAIRQSGVVLVGYQDAPSTGTDGEIAFAKRIGKPVVVMALTSKGLLPWYMERFGWTFHVKPTTDREQSEALNQAWREKRLFFGSSRDDYTTVADALDAITRRVILIPQKGTVE